MKPSENPDGFFIVMNIILEFKFRLKPDERAGVKYKLKIYFPADRTDFLKNMLLV